MEEITDGVTNINIAGDFQKKNRIQVSNTKKPLFFYVNLAKVLPRPFSVLAMYCWMYLLVNENNQSGFSLYGSEIGSLFVYVQRYMQQHNEVELSALGMGISRLLIYLVSFFRCYIRPTCDMLRYPLY